MDKIAIISDIHGNLPALEAALDDIHARGIDLIYNLGDVVGKGARSGPALERCREVCPVILRGNWEDALVRPTDNAVLAWYQEQLGDERLAYLDTLPGVYDFWLSGKRVRLFHASQESVHKRIYSTDTYETHLAMFGNTAFTGYEQPEPHIVGYGDIHVPYLRTLFIEQKQLFNVGSVGNALDMPLACYVILTGALDSRSAGAYSLEFVRLPYDIEREVEAAFAMGVPEADAYAVELRTAVYRGSQKAAVT